jgi:hypothetical protein
MYRVLSFWNVVSGTIKCVVAQSPPRQLLISKNPNKASQLTETQYLQVSSLMLPILLQEDTAGNGKW